MTIKDADASGYVLGLADDALIYAQRLGEWVARAPELEEDMALANVALDLLGQARALLTHVGRLDGTGRSEDDLAMFRDERDFRCVHLLEQPVDDFGVEMARMLTFATYQSHLYAALRTCADDVVAGVAAKAVKECAYHRDHAEQWVLRLGDGTEASHARMQAGLETLAPYVEELFDDDEASVDAAGAGLGVLPSSLRHAVLADIATVVGRASLAMPEPPTWHSRGGRAGIHSEAMGPLLAQMQHIARSHPGATW